MTIDLSKMIFDNTAIYIGDDFIDIARADIGFGAVSIRYLQRFPLLNSIKGRFLKASQDEISKILGKAFESTGSKPYKISVNLRNEAFLLRHFNLRDIPDNELQKAIAFEAQKYIHLPMEDLLFCFKKGAKQGSYRNIVFVASERKHISEITDFFKSLGIFSTIIEPVPILISQMLRSTASARKEKACISIHYEPQNKIIITGVWNKEAFFFREVKILPEETEFKTAELYYPPLADVWSFIANDVLGSVEYLRKETKADIAKIFISGFSYSPDETNLATDIGLVIERSNLDEFDVKPKESRDRFVPILALLKDSFIRASSNLAPKDIQYKDIWTFKKPIIRSLALLVLIVSFHFLLSGVNVSKANRIKTVKKSSDLYKVISPDASKEDIDKYKKIVEDKARFINNVVSSRVIVTEKLNHLAKDLTPNAWVSSFGIRNRIDNKKAPGSMRIEGSVLLTASGSSEINSLREKMKSDPIMMKGFGDIEVSSVKNKKVADKDVVEFELSFK